MATHVVRRAVAQDMVAVSELIQVCVCTVRGMNAPANSYAAPQALSDLENVSEKARLSAAELVRDGGFDPNSNAPVRFTCFVAELSDGRVVGYALCFFKTFTLKRRTLFVDSLFVHRAAVADEPQQRTIERDLADALCAFAIEHGSFRLDFHVLQDSELLPMWHQMGADDLTATMDMHHLRLHADAIEKLVAEA